MGIEQNVDWSKDPYWRSGRIPPAHIWIHDIRLARNPFYRGLHHHDLLEIYETLTSSLVDGLR
jgi:hypothetical protein